MASLEGRAAEAPWPSPFEGRYAAASG